MVRHNHIGGDEEAVFAANGLQFLFEDISRAWFIKIGQPVVATESDEVRLPASLVAP